MVYFNYFLCVHFHKCIWICNIFTYYLISRRILQCLKLTNSLASKLLVFSLCFSFYSCPLLLSLALRYFINFRNFFKCNWWLVEIYWKWSIHICNFRLNYFVNRLTFYSSCTSFHCRKVVWINRKSYSNWNNVFF